MGYDLHITRAKHWENNSGLEIRSSEWMGVVREDPQLVEDPTHGPCAVLFRGDGDREQGWFDWANGNVYTTDASNETLAKMLDLADRLGARVQGDDGESYRKDGQAAVRDRR